MAGINYSKVAKSFEKKGQLKKAADYYAGARDLKKAYELYEKVLSRANDRFVIRDIERRLRKLDAPTNLIRAAHEAGRRTLEKRVYAFLSMFFLIAALFSISFNVTGNSISNLTRSDLSLLGIALFVLGLMSFILFKTRKE